MGSKASFKMIFKENPGSWMFPSLLPQQPLKIFNPESFSFFLIIAAPAAPRALSNVEMALRESCWAETIHGFPIRSSHYPGIVLTLYKRQTWGHICFADLVWRVDIVCMFSWVGTFCVAPTLNWEGNIFPYFLCPPWTFPLWNMCCIVVLLFCFFLFPKELTGNRYFPSDTLI